MNMIKFSLAEPKVHLGMGFENLLSYAWYLFIEFKTPGVRDEATRALGILQLASRDCGFEKTGVEDFSLYNFTALKYKIRNQLISEEECSLALSYLLKYLHILDENRIIRINLIDIAMRL